MEQLIVVLKLLKTSTELLSKEKHVSVSLVAPVMFTLVNKHLDIKDVDSSLVNNFKKVVKDDIVSRYGRIFKCDVEGEVDFLLVATFLDPRHKHLPFLNETEKDKVCEYVRSKITAAIVDDVGANSETEQTFKKAKKDDFLGADYYSGFANIVQDEVNYYHQVPVVEGNVVDPLVWWNSQQTTLSQLASMAETYLSVPASSVASERMFSSAGRLLRKLRSSLSTKHVDQILFLNKNL